MEPCPHLHQLWDPGVISLTSVPTQHHFGTDGRDSTGGLMGNGLGEAALRPPFPLGGGQQHLLPPAHSISSSPPPSSPLTQPH